MQTNTGHARVGLWYGARGVLKTRMLYDYSRAGLQYIRRDTLAATRIQQYDSNEHGACPCWCLLGSAGYSVIPIYSNIERTNTGHARVGVDEITENITVRGADAQTG
jgi:hypothetical protein